MKGPVAPPGPNGPSGPRRPSGTSGPGAPGGEPVGAEDSGRAHEISRWAVAALVCAGLGFSFFPLFGIALGFIFAAKAERSIQAEPERYEGLEMVRWARRLAWLGVVIVSLSALVVGWAWWSMRA